MLGGNALAAEITVILQRSLEATDEYPSRLVQDQLQRFNSTLTDATTKLAKNKQNHVHDSDEPTFWKVQDDRKQTVMEVGMQMEENPAKRVSVVKIDQCGMSKRCINEVNFSYAPDRLPNPEVPFPSARVQDVCVTI